MIEPLSLASAQQKLIDLACPLGPETVLISQAFGRYLWTDLLALRTQPAADLSAMDGYAVANPDSGSWTIIGESAAGRPFEGNLKPGQAVRISTGAVVPNGASAVLLQEEAKVEGRLLSPLPGEIPGSRHIRRRGFDFSEGDEILTGGTRLSPAQLALAISAGQRTLEVGQLPRVAILDNGDELASGSDRHEDHRIPASNGAMIAAMLEGHATSIMRLGPVPDRTEALARALDAADGADVIVTSGGASVGDHDLIKPALRDWGASIDFWKVAIRPGKPLLLASKGSTLLLGLPGNPVSCFVTAYLFLLPLVRRLANARDPLPTKLRAKLRSPLPAIGSRLEMVRAIVDSGEIVPLDQQDSSALRSLAAANTLIERPANAPAAKAGDTVDFYWLQNGGMA